MAPVCVTFGVSFEEMLMLVWLSRSGLQWRLCGTQKGPRTHVCGVRQSLLEGNQELLVEACASSGQDSSKKKSHSGSLPSRPWNHRKGHWLNSWGNPTGFCFILSNYSPTHSISVATLCTFLRRERRKGRVEMQPENCQKGSLRQCSPNYSSSVSSGTHSPTSL